MLLEVSNLSIAYGAVVAVNNITFTVDYGKIICIIGANGAGKSTIMNAVCGIVKPQSGVIKFNGKNILGYPPHEIARMGIVQVPEGRGIFGSLTVKENLEIASTARCNKATLDTTLEHIYTLFPRLKERLNQRAGTLSGGEQQMLAFARALVTDAQLLLLDEPSMGLSPALVLDVFSTIKKINDEGKTILLVEQNANMALEIADWAYVLETGNIALSAAAKELRHDTRVKNAYLGG